MNVPPIDVIKMQILLPLSHFLGNAEKIYQCGDA